VILALIPSSEAPDFEQHRVDGQVDGCLLSWRPAVQVREKGVSPSQKMTEELTLSCLPACLPAA
jgi:hypothetical protein